jgi:hypothetical protein
VLADPVKNFPRLFGNSRIFAHFPFLLSCIAASSFAFAGFFFGAIWLKETKRKRFDALHHAEINEPVPSFREVLTPDVTKILVHNAILAFISTGIESILPLILYTPRHLGGLGASEAVIGQTLSGALFFLGFSIGLTADQFEPCCQSSPSWSSSLCSYAAIKMSS